MALCDFLLTGDITGYNCMAPNIKGAKPDGLIINRADINLAGVTYETDEAFAITALPLKSGKVSYDIVQSGKTPFNGSQQELQEGTYINTFNNTIQFVILNQNGTTAEQIFELMNGEFVVILKDNNGNYQVFGLEGGLRASAIAREYYSDDALAGWTVTLMEENAIKGSLFISETLYNTLKGV